MIGLTVIENPWTVQMEANFMRTYQQRDAKVLAELYRDCEDCRGLVEQFPSPEGNWSKKTQAMAEQVWRDNVIDHLRGYHKSDDYSVARSGRRIVRLVEAAGVEPASADVTGQETTCLVEFRGPQRTRKPPGVTFRHPRSEPTRHASR